jgi:hypothetical protein
MAGGCIPISCKAFADTVISRCRQVIPHFETNIHAVPWLKSDYNSAITRIAGAEHGENGGPDTDVFNNIGIILNLAYIARINPDLPYTILYDTEWKLLYCAANRTTTSLREVRPPEKPYTIAEAVNYAGWLGGPKTAPGDGPPGVKTIWKGMKNSIPCLTTGNCLIYGSSLDLGAGY